MEKMYTIVRCFQERYLGLMDSPSSWKIVKLVFLRRLDAAHKKGIRSYRATELTSVISKWYASCIILLLQKEKGPVKCWLRICCKNTGNGKKKGIP